MEYIKLTKENLNKEHICCALSDKQQVAEKKSWLAQRMEEGLIFYRLDDKGKAFIEYTPSHATWYPIEAENMMVIDCFWVSGKHKGKGISNALLSQCIQDAKKAGMDGILAISGQKKLGYLSDSDYLRHKGFTVCDEALPFQLYVLPFHELKMKPHFSDTAKTMRTQEDGFSLYYTPQCPFALKYAQILKQRLEQGNIPVHLHLIPSKEEAQKVPAPWNVYALFVDGIYLTHEIQSEKMIEKLIKSYGNRCTD